MNDLVEASLEAIQHDKAKAEYGSWTNFRAKIELDRGDTSIREEYLTSPFQYEEETLEAMTAGVPYPMDTVTLHTLPLFMLGAPDNSWLHKRIRNGDDIRARRKPVDAQTPPSKPFWYDYSEHGWPSDQGHARRMVSEEEHRAILSRLSTGLLTRPGSPVPLRSQTLAELIEEDLPEPGWVIEGLLREGGALMVYGPSGIGKTWFVHTLMLMASHGRGVGVWDPEMERWVLRAGPHEGLRVGLIDGEMRKEDIASRAVVLCGALGLKPGTARSGPEAIDPEQLRMVLEKDGTDPKEIAEWTAHFEAAIDTASEFSDVTSKDSIDLEKIDLYLKQDQHPRAIFPDLVDPEWKHQVIQYTKSAGIQVLILDNLATLCPSLEDENAAAEWAPLNELVVALKQAGVATILVHHSGKSKEGSYRGSSNLTTVLENTVQLSKVESEGAENTGACFKIELGKRRTLFDAVIDGKTFRLREGTWVIDPDPVGDAERVLRLLKTHRYTTQHELGIAVDRDQSWVSRKLKEAVVLSLTSTRDIKTYWDTAKALRYGTGLPDIDVSPDQELDI